MTSPAALNTSQPQPSAKPAYQKPAVADLGPWQKVTLVFSLPIGPGGPKSSKQF